MSDSQSNEPQGRHRRRYEATHTVHNQEPDYERPLFQLSEELRNRMLSRLEILYGTETALEYMPELERILKVYYAHKPDEMIQREMVFNPQERFTEEDVILITYGDLIKGEDSSPLATLSKFSGKRLSPVINTLHILPFFPYSSDRGFSIIDFETVDPQLGTWADIEDLEGRFQLMFDGVINHVSSKSRWFQEFLNGDRYYGKFFISYEDPDSLTTAQRQVIFRPRTSDILTPFNTINGTRYVWTTFSRDQIDLNYHNPEVLLRVIEILLVYVRHGADIIRLDAITYIWAEPGTPCVHLQQTHAIVKLFRDVLDAVAPSVALITETNVPHKENISYFGNGYDEAQMVYNFALPPLVLHAFYTQNASYLTAWARELEPPSKETTFFNFLDSHDGVGLMAIKNILPPEEIDLIVKTALRHGGYISYKSIEGGKQEPYEINITWFSALNRDDTDEDDAFQVQRFVASRAVALALKGVPGVYLHSLFGSRNDVEAVLATDSKRAINRTMLDASAIEEALEDPFSQIALIQRKHGRLGRARTTSRAFHPSGGQKVFDLSPQIFCVLRTSPEGDLHTLCLINVSNAVAEIELPLDQIGLKPGIYTEKINDAEMELKGPHPVLHLEPYDVLFLEP
jgi:glycosidase